MICRIKLKNKKVDMDQTQKRMGRKIVMGAVTIVALAAFAAMAVLIDNQTWAIQ